MSEPNIYISYGWEVNSEKVVENICKVLEEKNIKYKLDKKDLKYTGSIKEFEESLGKGDLIVLIVSDKFLKSKHCMYEMLKIKENGDMRNRILPIVLDDAKIHEDTDRIEYVQHWENKIHELDTAMKKVSSANLGVLRNDIDNFTEFRKIIIDIIDTLSDMNILNWSTHEENNYAELIKRIEEQIETNVLVSKDEDDSEVAKIESRIVNQHGRNTVYIEKNEGEIHFG